jgi:hypothetical protein
VPAPAVIPAPKAYINAVAVKGFVVELGAVKNSRAVLLDFIIKLGLLFALAACEHLSETTLRGIDLSPHHLHASCA